MKAYRALCHPMRISVNTIMIAGTTISPLYADTGLRIQALGGGVSITKERILSSVLTGAWNFGKDLACDELKDILSTPGDYSAYETECFFGSDVQVTAAEPLSDGFMLHATVSRSRVTAEYTQPFVGQFADPSVEFFWVTNLRVKAEFTDVTCAGVPFTIPWLRFEDVSMEMVSTDVNVDSTLSDIFGGLMGFFGGMLFSGVAAIPGAVAGAMGTTAIIEGIAADQVPTGSFNFARKANEIFEGELSPCELVTAFGEPAGPLVPMSFSTEMVVLAVTKKPSPIIVILTEYLLD